MLDFLLERFAAHRDVTAIVWSGREFSYGWLLEKIRSWERIFDENGIVPGWVAALEADFSPASIALFIALIGRRAILVPLTQSVANKKDEFIELAQCQISFRIDAFDNVEITRLGAQADHPIYRRLVEMGNPGLVLFSSGSTGKSKAAVHDLLGILEKFRTPRPAQRTITFLLYDHIGGVNTFLHTLSNGGTVITVNERTPDAVLGVVEKYRAELLPTSPTFLNLILISEAYRRHDLSSLKRVTYGTEPMNEHTLKAFHRFFPRIELLQTYGLSEVGILRSKSRSSDSLWVKVGGEGFETRIVDSMLQIKARSAMLGYLNAPSPFTEDGWFMTGDAVDVDGDYIKILGRTSEIINVGGEKVYPAEVENVIQEMDAVADVTVYGEKNAIIGNIVCARITLRSGQDEKEFTQAVKRHCRSRLERFKVPVKVFFQKSHQHGERFKKTR